MTQRIQRLKHNGERYDFDLKLCTAGAGWAQVDTWQDASYFGMWADPIHLRIVTFAEGDVTVETADGPEDFAGMIRAHEEWFKENRDEKRSSFKIDGMLREDIIEAFTKLGLADLLH